MPKNLPHLGVMALIYAGTIMVRRMLSTVAGFWAANNLDDRLNFIRENLCISSNVLVIKLNS